MRERAEGQKIDLKPNIKLTTLSRLSFKCSIQTDYFDNVKFISRYLNPFNSHKRKSIEISLRKSKVSNNKILCKVSNVWVNVLKDMHLKN